MTEKALDIRHFKMINGDEVLALVNQNNDTNMLVERPVVVNANMLGGYTLAPWFPFSKASLFRIMKNRIIASVKIDEKVQQNYINFVLQKEQPEAKIQSTSELLDNYRDALMAEHAAKEEIYEDYMEEEEINDPTIH
jgi:hypothetical protein|tara:strand:+ start:213 stop:623 length:411 start_codon:yes stop_codon:yes gene_type:complete